jgi:hypothetical protein
MDPILLVALILVPAVLAALTALYVKTRDALFVSMGVIVLAGLAPSLYVAARMPRRGLSHP